jgi:hypothetical protein
MECYLGFGDHSALALKHAARRAIQECIGENFSVHYLHQVALAIYPDRINAIAVAFDGISTMATPFLG